MMLLYIPLGLPAIRQACSPSSRAQARTSCTSAPAPPQTARLLLRPRRHALRAPRRTVFPLLLLTTPKYAPSLQKGSAVAVSIRSVRPRQALSSFRPAPQARQAPRAVPRAHHIGSPKTSSGGLAETRQYRVRVPLFPWSCQYATQRSPAAAGGGASLCYAF